MPRSAPSRADAELLAALADAGYRCSRYKLERWRQHGLLPPSVVQHPGGGGSTAILTDEAVERAVLLSWHARPGVAWQLLGLALAEAGYELSDLKLRECLNWLLALEERGVSSYVDKVSARLVTLRQEAPDELDLAEAIAALVRGSRHERGYLRVNVPIIASRYSHLSRREHYELARTGMLWNVAERLGEELVGETKRLAQGWRDDDEAAAGGFYGQADPPRVTISDLQAVADTVTSAEYRTLLIAAQDTLADVNLTETTGLVSRTLLRSLAQLRCVWMGDAAWPLGTTELAEIQSS